VVSNPRLKPVILVLFLLFSSTQQMAALPTNDVSANPCYLNSLNSDAHQPCQLTDCFGSTTHCCTFAVCHKTSLGKLEPKSAPLHLLGYFFSSRTIAPSEPPPKPLGG